MPIFCNNCGYENSGTEKFCKKCSGEIVLITGKTLTPGLLLDKRYEIKRKIKSGGMGAIYEALDHRFEKTPCAVKELLGSSADPQEEKYFIERFTEEAKILHKLRHHNLPVVKDYFIENGRYYLVMDYIEGDDLDTIILRYADKGVPENLVIKWSKQILDALIYLHNQSPPVIYRDLKPANVMLQKSEDKIMLVDFGIARTVEPENKKTLTVVGTPAFAPEELFQGRPEQRTDIYSLGGTMHCLLTGKIPVNPFSFEPVRKINSSVSEELEAVIMKALSMNINNRYASAEEMKEVLEKITGPAIISSAASPVIPDISVAVNTPVQISHDAPTVLPADDKSIPVSDISVPATFDVKVIQNVPAVIATDVITEKITGKISETAISSAVNKIASVKSPENFQIRKDKIFLKKKLLIYSFIIFSCLTVILIFLLHFLPVSHDNMTLISVPFEKEEARGPSWSPSISEEGLYMAFVSEADNLTEEDKKGKRNIFLWNKKTGEKTIISNAPDGSPASGDSSYPSLSSDGHYVVFASKADNLVKNDRNDKEDIFLYNSQNGETILISVTHDGIHGNGSSSFPSVSSDGTYVVFSSEASNLVKDDKNGKEDIFMWNRKTKKITLLSISPDGKGANNPSETPCISPDGTYVVFASEASNLAKNNQNGKENIFLCNLKTHNIICITEGYDGKEANGSSYSPCISSGGAYIVFRSDATNLIKDDKNDKEDIFLYEVKKRKTICISVTPEGMPCNGASWSPCISSDGRIILFISSSTSLVTDDTEGKEAIFKYDRDKKLISFVSFASDRQKTGHYQRLSLSPEGNYLAFEYTDEDTLKKENIFLQNLNTGNRIIVTESDGATSWEPSTSSAGRFVAFSSDGNLIKEDLNDCRDIYLYESGGKKLSLLSVSSDGTPVDGSSRSPSINYDGSYVAFVSDAGNLIKNDKNNSEDVFLRNRLTGTTSLISVASDKKTQGNDSSCRSSISGDGCYVSFESSATNLVEKDLNGKKDVFIHDIKRGKTSRISISSDGNEGNGDSRSPSISSDGRFTVFISTATNLVQGDSNKGTDLFLRDIKAGKTVSVKTSGMDCSYPVISGDGNYIAFVSGSNHHGGDEKSKKQVFLYEIKTGKMSLISCGYDSNPGNDNSRAPSISYNGQYIVFISRATNLIKGDTNNRENVYIYNRRNRKLSSISAISGKGGGIYEFPSISCDGYFIAFAWKEKDEERKENIFLYERGHHQNGFLNFIKDIME